MKIHWIWLFFMGLSGSISAQSITDDFEGNGNIDSWIGDDCNLKIDVDNPFKKDKNNSSKVLEYQDYGGKFANIRFDAGNNFTLLGSSVFSFKIYVPSNSLTGNQTNQVSLKLQNATLATPWINQSSIVKEIKLDEWQTVTFDFATDFIINFDANSRRPIERLDFNRVLIQVNGEDNNDQVTAYIDDFLYAYNGLPEHPFTKLVWSDEFEIEGAVNPENWHHQTIFPNGFSWYNDEIQHYTDRIENSFVKDGNLNILAKKEDYTDQNVLKNYTSARLNSKFAFTYGRVEIRAKLPTGVGTWPAMWMLGQNINEKGAYWQTRGMGDTPWPACGEIDIMEHWGDNQNWVTSATHTPSSHGNTINVGGQILLTASEDFHLYTLEWTEDYMVFKVDEKAHLILSPKEKTSANWPFDQNQYLVLNVAIQPHIDPAFVESALEIDYIRVYQETSTSAEDQKYEKRYQVYPNPAENELVVELNYTPSEPLNFSFFDMAGNMVSHMSSINSNKIFRIPLSERFKPGIYIINIQDEEKITSQKFFRK
jgi:beta-glucanase (GH16 family)